MRSISTGWQNVGEEGVGMGYFAHDLADRTPEPPLVGGGAVTGCYVAFAYPTLFYIPPLPLCQDTAYTGYQIFFLPRPIAVVHGRTTANIYFLFLFKYNP